jgi:hypothetical protein
MMMSLKRESFTDGLSTIERITLLTRRMSAAEQRESQAVMTALWGKWGFEHSIGACEHYWQNVPADPDAKPLSLAWYREKILRDISYVRRIVALRESPAPLQHQHLEAWILAAMQLGRLTEEAVWKLRLGDDARLGLKIRAKNTAAAKRRGADLHADAAPERAKILDAIRRYRRLQPDDSAREVARSLAKRLARSESTIRRLIAQDKLA